MQMTESDKLHGLAVPETTPIQKRHVQEKLADWALGQDNPELALREALAAMGLLGET